MPRSTDRTIHVPGELQLREGVDDFVSLVVSVQEFRSSLNCQTLPYFFPFNFYGKGGRKGG